MSISLRSVIILIQKNETLQYNKIIKCKLIDIFSNPSTIKKINNVNCKGYMKKKLEMRSEKDSHYVNSIRESIKQTLEKILTEKPQETKEALLVGDDIPPMRPTESDEEVKKRKEMKILIPKNWKSSTTSTNKI